MSRTRLVLGRSLTVAVLAGLPQCTPLAHAVSPPPIDESRLPRVGLASPPQPTVQSEICAVPSVIRNADVSQLSSLDLQQVWKLTRGSGQRVAVLDTGVAPHPRLPHVTAGGDYVFTGDGMQDCDGHGTAVAGIIAAVADSRHGDDFGGVAPGVGLISIRQSSTRFRAASDPTTPGFGDVDTMARAVRAAADLGATVINISAVACARADSALDDRPLGAALAYAVDTKNVVVVAAAGNAGTGQCPAPQPEATVVVSPAWYDDFVLTVGSVNSRGEPSSFTLAGPWVDVAAPGEGVISLSTSGAGLANALGGNEGPTPLAGTSYAAPVVSGLAALIRSRFPTWTARQVMQRIKATARHPPGGWDPRVGAGSVDFLAAVSTDAPMATALPAPPVLVPIAETTPAATPDHGAREAALTGAAVCGGLLAMMLTGRATWTRLRRATRDRRDIPGD